MSLIKCPECKKEVSTDAKMCPGCGYAVKAAISKKKRGNRLAILGVLFLMFVFISMLFKPTPPATTSTVPASTQHADDTVPQTTGSGRFLDHSYTYKEKNGVIAALFEPPLARDDAILVGIMAELTNRLYGKHQIEDLTPVLVSKGGTNLLKLRGIGYDYYYLPIKQDTDGKILGMSMWREKRAGVE